MILSILIGFASGIISGMGIGGGAILIPALILFSGASQQVAQGINLLYFLPTAAVALIVHIRHKNVALKPTLLIGISGILGAVGGALLAACLSGDFLRRAFGIFLLLIGISEIIKGFRLRRSKS